MITNRKRILAGLMCLCMLMPMIACAKQGSDPSDGTDLASEATPLPVTAAPSPDAEQTAAPSPDAEQTPLPQPDPDAEKTYYDESQTFTVEYQSDHAASSSVHSPAAAIASIDAA